jgi:hypothetical protein
MRSQVGLTGVLLLLAGVPPLAGVADPDLWNTFSGTNEQALHAVADHPVSTEIAGFPIGAGFALAIPAVAGLAHIVATPAARLAVPMFTASAAMTLAWRSSCWARPRWFEAAPRQRQQPPIRKATATWSGA